MNVANMGFRIITHFELDGKDIGNYISRFYRNVLTQEFIQRRNEVADYVNPHYEEWNEEFNSKYPEKDGYSIEYLKYIASMMQPYCDKVSKRSKVLEMFTCDDRTMDDGGGEIMAYIKGTHIRMYVTLGKYADQQL